jgi:1-deoxy-D-xylulose-5-phosphate synthase
MRELSRKVLGKIPWMWKFAQRAEEHFKGMVVPGTLFEELGFHYIGPIDGHDLGDLLRTLRLMKGLSGPQFLHIITKKGKGYSLAEQDPIRYHGVGAKISQSAGAQTRPSYTEIFGSWICKAAGEHKNLVGITPAMREGSGLVEFSEKYPERFIDVGIAEQHAVTLAAGMATSGMVPVVAIYSTFLQRAYDQLIHDVAIQNLHVIFAIDRAGLVGADGPTHAGSFDISFMRPIPNMVLMAPAYDRECTEMLDLCLEHQSPAAVRYPRGAAVPAPENHASVEFGKANMVREGQKVAILVFGALLENALGAANQANATVVNMRFVKPLDSAMIDMVAANHNLIVTVEENVVAGGAGAAVAEYLHANDNNIAIRHLGLPDKFVEHGDKDALLKTVGLDSKGILASLSGWV